MSKTDEQEAKANAKKALMEIVTHQHEHAMFSGCPYEYWYKVLTGIRRDLIALEEEVMQQAGEEGGH